MKKHIAFILLIAMILTLAFSTTAIYAKSDAEVVKDFLKSQIVFDDFVKFKESVDSDDGGKIFMCVLEIYPDFVAQMKKCSNDDTYENTATLITPVTPLLLVGAGGVIAGVAGTLIAVKIKKKKTA